MEARPYGRHLGHFTAASSFLLSLSCSLFLVEETHLWGSCHSPGTSTPAFGHVFCPCPAPLFGVLHALGFLESCRNHRRSCTRRQGVRELKPRKLNHFTRLTDKLGRRLFRLLHNPLFRPIRNSLRTTLTPYGHPAQSRSRIVSLVGRKCVPPGPLATHVTLPSSCPLRSSL